MNIRTSEYDAFGPWIYLIDDEHLLPKLFEPYKYEFEGALMCFKIPREIERRKANPDMHLYDAVVGLFPTHIIMLKRDNNRVIISRAELKDIIAMENSHYLLLGKVTLYLKQGVFEIEYNTVSVAIMEQFVDAIRENIDYTEKVLDMSFLEYDTKTIDYLFAHLVDDFRKNDEDIGLIAYQPNHEVQAKKDFFSRLFEASRAKRITCVAFLANKSEVIVINRSSPLKSKEKEEYAYTYLYLPTDNISKAEVWKKADSVQAELRLSVGEYEFISNFTDSSKGIEALAKLI